MRTNRFRLTATADFRFPLVLQSSPRCLRCAFVHSPAPAPPRGAAMRFRPHRPSRCFSPSRLDPNRPSRPSSALSGLPRPVARELQRRACTIPQVPFTKQPHNVIHGQFTRPGQTDWAVLCSVHGVSTILIFPNGAERSPAALAPMEDRIFLQGIAPGRMAFSRAITPVGRDFVTRHFQAYGGPTPPPLDHQGIDDAFLEKASVTWYFYNGKWLQLTGAD